MEGESIKEIKETFEIFKREIESKKRRYLHVKSVENFLKYFDALSEEGRVNVSRKLHEYCEELKLHSPFLAKKDSVAFCRWYIMPIGAIYENELSFKRMIDWGFILFWGISFDACLFLTGLSKFYFQVPLCLLVMSIRKIYYIRIESAGKMYGLFY